MIMLMGQLIGGKIAPYVPRAIAEGGDTGAEIAVSKAQAAQDKAGKMWNDMMSQMDSMKKMPMSANEKEMMKMMEQMAMDMKALLEANMALLTAIKEMRKGGANK